MATPPWFLPDKLLKVTGTKFKPAVMSFITTQLAQHFNLHKEWWKNKTANCVKKSAEREKRESSAEAQWDRYKHCQNPYWSYSGKGWQGQFLRTTQYIEAMQLWVFQSRAMENLGCSHCITDRCYPSYLNCLSATQLCQHKGSNKTWYHFPNNSRASSWKNIDVSIWR